MGAGGGGGEVPVRLGVALGVAEGAEVGVLVAVATGFGVHAFGPEIQ
jgi:hypothetical protein